MLIGVPKEIKNQEYRVGLTPAGTRELVLIEVLLGVIAGAHDAQAEDDPLLSGSPASAPDHLLRAHISRSEFRRGWPRPLCSQ